MACLLGLLMQPALSSKLQNKNEFAVTTNNEHLLSCFKQPAASYSSNYLLVKLASSCAELLKLRQQYFQNTTNICFLIINLHLLQFGLSRINQFINRPYPSKKFYDCTSCSYGTKDSFFLSVEPYRIVQYVYVSL